MRKICSRFLSIFLITALVIGMVGAISLDTSYAASKKKVHINEKSIYIAQGTTYQQKLINKNGKVIKASKVKWKSKNKKVAKINKKGTITAVKIGKTKMTAKYKGKTYKFTVEVYKPVIDTPVIKNLTYDTSSKTIDIQLLSTIGDAQECEIYYSYNDGNYIFYGKQKFTGYGILTFTENQKSKLEGKYTFKLRGVCGNYKGNFSQEKSIFVDPKVYDKSDIFNLLTYVGNAVDWSEAMITDEYNWDVDSYSAYSSEVKKIKSDTKGANDWIKAAQKITGGKYSRSCTKSEAINAGYTTWDGMLLDIIAQCNYIESADVSSMSQYDRMMYAMKVLTAAKAINIAYIEIYGN